jgi:hypothetical protein
MKYELKEINLIINTGSITTTWAETKYLLKIFYVMMTSIIFFLSVSSIYLYNFHMKY